MTDEDNARSPQPNAGNVLSRVQQRLIASIHNAVDTARRDAKDNLEALGLRHQTPADDHYTFIALRSLFLDHCGADRETARGGDPRRAARLLHIGGRMSRYWEREKDGQKDRRKKLALSEEDEKDRRDWFEAAQNLAFKTVVQTLVEHASASDPSLRDRATARVEDFIAGLDPKSEQTVAVADWARASIARLLRPPEPS